MHLLIKWAVPHDKAPLTYPAKLGSFTSLVDSAWPSIRDDLEQRQEDPTSATQPRLLRKRKFIEPDPAPTSDAMDVDGGHSQMVSTANKRRKGSWTKLVAQVLELVLPTEALNMETEGLETMMSRLIRSVIKLPDFV